MGLFDHIPESFFSILASKNKEIYVEALMELNNMFRYGVNVEVEDFAGRLKSRIEYKEYFVEEDDDIEAYQTGLTVSTKARLIISKLIKHGWIDKEYRDGTFVEVIILHDYTIKTLELLEVLSNQRRQEYNSLVFSAYSGLKQAKTEEPERLYDALISAKENTTRLISELKSLYHNIRDYYREISLYSSVNQLLKEHFDEYQVLIDRIYHPIKTMDSIHRYSFPIKSMLMEILVDDDLLETMELRAMSVKLYENEFDARQAIEKDIDYILEAYNSVGDLIDQIDKKHSLYNKISSEKIQYLLNTDRSIKGKLITILQEYSKSNRKDEMLELLKNKINLQQQDSLDKKSLYHRTIRKRMYLEPLKITQNNEHEKLELYNDMIKQMNKGYSISKVKQYIHELLDGKERVSTEEIEIHNNKEFTMLILGAIRANERSMNYQLIFGEGSINRNGYIVPNMTFIKKEQ